MNAIEGPPSGSLAGSQNQPGKNLHQVDQSADELILGDDIALPILAALAAMASRSKRREAEVRMAIGASGILVDARTQTRALSQLEAEGLISKQVTLYDGGAIIVVTWAGFDRLRGTAFEQALGPIG